MKPLNLKLWRDLKTMGVQVFSIALLIVGGISVLVSSWSSYQSLNVAKKSFYDNYRFADLFAEVVRAPDSAAVTVARMPGIEKVETRIIKEGLVDVAGQLEPALGRFISWRGSEQALNLIYLRQGRLPEATSDYFEVIVHEAFAVAHKLNTGDRLEVLLSGKKIKLLISGIGLSPEYVYALSPVAPLPDDKHFGIFWMRHSDLEKITGMQGTFNSMLMKANSSASIEELKRQVDLALQIYGNIMTIDRNQQQSNVFVEDEIRQQRIMAIVMPSIFLVVAVFILNIILSRIVTLHRAQIATLKSLGYSSFAVTFHYFQLVTVILIVGIIPAIWAGSGIGKWYAQLYESFFRFPVISFKLSGTAIVIGFAAGLIPGWLSAAGALAQIFNLQPAEALRPPSPPAFHLGLFERVRFLNRFDIFAKMVLRSILFRPVRLTLSVVGISAALAILINGSFWTDVIDFMINRQFYQMHREDLTVRLAHPKNQSVFSEISRISGVLEVEGERTLPVRIQFKNHTKETQLLGLRQSARLSRVLDRTGRELKPPHDGVLLSEYFESKFNLRKGDFIRVKVLQGEQREFDVLVQGFVEDLIGQQVYASKESVHKWLNEAPVVDTLTLRVDPTLVSSIYVALKSRPEVLGINDRRLLLKSFTDTVAQMIMTFTIILYVFAIAIAGAVMYNSARISFSERGWELASLRILGFDIKSTFEVLFVEIGVHILLSLVPGLLLGYWLSYLSTHFIHNDTFKFPLVIDWATYAAATLILIGTFLMSGVILYRKVKKLNFSEALKARD